MRIHYILLSSSYSEHCRIALHYPISEGADTSHISRIIGDINALYDGKPVSLSIHVKVTEDDSWESVIRKDPYFEDVRIIDDPSEFKALITKDRYLKGIDVSDYILSRLRCTHLKLEKLTYLCYADYLCRTGKRLFDDRIYAFKYGPVVDSVRRKYDEVSKEHPGEAIQDSYLKYRPSNRLAARSRIIFSEDGTEKLFSIEDTLSKYGRLSGDRLKDITHHEGTPWSNHYREGVMFIEIPNESILKYHSAELLRCGNTDLRQRSDKAEPPIVLIRIHTLP